jgi:hypothetical protein
VEAYNPATNTWSTRASMPTARSFLAAAPGPDGQLYVFGGLGFVFGRQVSLSTVEAYNPATNTWTTRASMFTARDLLAAAPGSDSQLYAFGGEAANGQIFFAAVEAYLPTGLSGTGNRSISVSGNKRRTGPDKVGLFHGDGTWTLDLGGGGSDPVTFLFGIPGDTPIVGDWNGSGTNEVGVVRVAPNAFAPDGRHALVVSLDLNGDRQWDAGDMSFYFGEEGDQIVLGDWNGDGKTKLGVVRPDGTGSLSWSLDFNGEHNWIVYHFGLPGDTALSGDWTGDGKDKIGVTRADTSETLPGGVHLELWALDYAGTGVFTGTVSGFGDANDAILLGDWTGSGKTKMGGAHPAADGVGADILFFNDFPNLNAEHNLESFPFGLASDIFFRGDWTGNGKDTIGVARPSGASALAFTLDSNGDHAYDAGDQTFTLPGHASDAVFVGNWHP